MTGPTDAHSSCFSKDSAGKDEDPGKVMPRASAALAIVLAVYIYVPVDEGFWAGGSKHSTYTTTCPRTGTGMPYCIISFTFGLRSFSILEILAI